MNCEICDTLFETIPSNKRKYCSRKCYVISTTLEFKDTQKIRQLAELTLDGIDLNAIPLSELSESDINDIFKLDIINALGIDADMFALK